MIPDISEAQYAQGDLVRAVQLMIHSHLPLTTDGEIECERLMRKNGEGNTRLWTHPHYLSTTIHLALEIVSETRSDAFSAKRKWLP